jgi:glycosyltransferase involved in cell wall biosynthesis
MTATLDPAFPLPVPATDPRVLTVPRPVTVVPGPSDAADRSLVRGSALLAGRRVLVLNWRDVQHPETGGAETYAHEISRRWVAAGAEVTWLTARGAGQTERDRIDGVTILRAGGTLSVYARTALRLLRTARAFDAVLDCQNGIPFFAPLFGTHGVPVVQLVHHVHQDQFSTRFPAPAAAVGRVLEGRVSRKVYADRRTVAVSASTRQELRRRLRFRGPIDVVPNGLSVPLSDYARAEAPTVAVVSRLVPHKRVDLLVRAVAEAAPAVPGLRVDVVGGGPELESLRALTTELGLDEVLTLHGRLPAAERDRLLGRAWLTTCTSAGEGWGLSVMEAAAAGVPCLALRAPGVRDSVIEGTTGWLVDDAGELGAELVSALGRLADPDVRAHVGAECHRWAGAFDWDRSADLLAGVLRAEIGGAAGAQPGRTRRTARTDMTVLVRFDHPEPARAAARMRYTDEVVVAGTTVTALLRGCDEVDAHAVLTSLGVHDAEIRLATRHELLGGPCVVPPRTTA